MYVAGRAWVYQDVTGPTKHIDYPGTSSNSALKKVNFIRVRVELNWYREEKK